MVCDRLNALVLVFFVGWTSLVQTFPRCTVTSGASTANHFLPIP